MSDMDAVDQAPETAHVAFAPNPIIGGTVVFAKVVPQCHVCRANSDVRAFIEEQYTIGRTAKEIIALISSEEVDPLGISDDSINRHHLRGHCTTPQALRLMPQWIKAANEGLDPHNFDQVANASVAVIKLLMEQIREEVLSGKIDMDMKDRLSVVKLMHEYEQQTGQKTDFGANEIYVAVSVFMSLVQATFARFIPMDQNEAMDYFRRLLDADPIIQTLIEQSREYEGTIDYDEFDVEDDGEDVVDAVVVEVSTEVLDEPAAIEYSHSGSTEEEYVDPTVEWEPLEQ
jgi:hypothetical protein